jgi:hypothetical protein
MQDGSGMPTAGIEVFTSLVPEIEAAGWAATPPLVEPELLDRVAADLAPLARDGRGGLRNLLDVSAAVGDLARHPAPRGLATAVLGAGGFVARAIFFDKTPDANWKVVWHQDLTIAVQARRDVPGFGPWSVKAGVTHVQPPAEVLERMLAVRVHLDDCTADNGPVRVLPGSHRGGKLTAAAVDAWKASTRPIDCLVARGGLLAFRPLVLHASAPATRPGHRRVVHLEFATGELPGGLAWQTHE